VTLGPNAIALGDMSFRSIDDDHDKAGTIMRMLGNLDFVANAGGSGQIGIGVTVQTSDGNAAGAASAPNPLGVGTSTRQGWYFWFVATMKFDGTGDGLGKTESFDIRTMRRIRAGFTLGLVFESGAYSGSLTTVTINWQSRNLWKPE